MRSLNYTLVTSPWSRSFNTSCSVIQFRFLFQPTKLQLLYKPVISWITPNSFPVSLHQIPTHASHSLLNPIFPTFILHLKDAFVHELLVMVVLLDSSSFIEAIGSNIPPLGFAFTNDCYTLFYCHDRLLCFKVNTSEERQIHQLALFVGVVWIHGLVEAKR